ncbi:facilitated trehalose transporter Tret1 isoform X2 [Plutella xylostella]|nr:facilitated trehalose transporter Tret1 isoform X2 [Plutella xylostella]XP_048487646.1 facilitated trehalose transporter Tret1 isoform X2 [Plutella xylostella]
MGHGAAFGYTAILVAHYTDDQGNKMGNDHLSWIGSVFGISKICGCFIMPSTMSMFGRQKTHLITVLPMLLNWLLFVFGRSVSIFITARLLFGISAGMYASMNSMLIAEYTDPVNRGAFSSISSLAVGFGVIWVHVWGTVVSWRTTAAVTIAIPVATAIITWFSPETPSWLVSKQRYGEARKVFTWLRGDGPRQRKEIEDLIESDKLKKETSNLSNAESKTCLTKLRMIKKCMLTREFYQPIFICVLVAIIFEFIGAHFVAAYGHLILKSLLNKNEPKDVSWHLNYLDILRPVVNCMGVIILKKIKRRTILFTTALMSILCLLLLSSYIYTRNAYGFNQTPLLDIFVMSLMTLYTVSHYAGYYPLAYVLFGEVIPLEYRGIGSSIVIFSLSICSFTVLKTCPQMYFSIGVEGSFLVFTVIISVCLVILYYILPETKDRTLLDIEKEFRDKKTEKPHLEVKVRLMKPN